MKPKPAAPPALASSIPVHCAHLRIADVTSLIPNPRNPNKHGDTQVALLAKVIRHQGWRAPITISRRSGFVVTGHGRLEAAKLLQVAEVPVDEQDFATEADEWAHLIADNRIAELADADRAMLRDLAEELDSGSFDMELTGFDHAALEELMTAAPPEGVFSADEVTPPTLANGDRAPFRQCTFTLHDEQFEEIEAAIKKAKAEGGGESAVNENSNGNALAWICGRFNRG